ncbi:glutathione peroxidase [Clostridium folliculivorans]|uniref:Glutathione peroxidase n=1 Tax=Clostridium folliculivorans TaxID=2886038 RepID=A0A9W5Y4D2_9CLOT|nr:glutathione peroxidase [Clostridium folliculivorans]GKU26347.1 glutathione peroxidase [Clostridium folliculivorans]GKU32098.1 glutathione peroxidase [Clostridium folliculivorans]
MSIYDFKAIDIDGREVDFSDYKGKVLLIVNTASKCGLTPQFKELEDLYNKLRGKNFEILGFPCNQFASQDPGNSEEIKSFCLLNYGVTFKMFEKVDVNGENAHPIYKYLTSQKGGILNKAVKWNFTKFLVDSNGNVVDRFAPTTSPSKIEEDINKLLKDV